MATFFSTRGAQTDPRGWSGRIQPESGLKIFHFAAAGHIVGRIRPTRIAGASKILTAKQRGGHLFADWTACRLAKIETA